MASYSDYNSSNSGFSQKAGRRDISQFVKYILEGSGVDEANIDFAGLRRELENIEQEAMSSPSEPPKVITMSEELNPFSGLDTMTSPIQDSPPIYSNIKAEDFHLSQDFREVKEIKSKLYKQQESIEIGYSQDFRDLNDLKHSLQNLATQIHDLPEHQPVVFENITIPPVSSISLDDLSAKLNNAGFPSLPPSLTSDMDGNQQNQLIKALYWSLQNTLLEYKKKSKQNQDLISKCQLVSQQSEHLAQQLDHLEKSRTEDFESFKRQMEMQNKKSEEYYEKLEKQLHLEKRKYDDYQEELHQAHRQHRQLAEALQQSNDEVSNLKQKNKRLEMDLQNEKEKNKNLQKEIRFREDEEMEKKLKTEELIRKMLGKSTKKINVTKEMKEIIEYYENRLRHKGVEALTSMPTLNANRVEQTQTSRPVLTVDDEKELEEKIEKNHERVKEAMLEEIDELKEELEAVTTAYSELQDENELLKLKLISCVPGADIVKDRKPQVATREFVRRDKENYKTREINTDSLTEGDSQKYLKQICEKLKIKKISTLISSLDEIAQTIKLIPQMQNYIRNIDLLTWSATEQNQEIKKTSRLHKLKDTFATLKLWRELMDGELKLLRHFKSAVLDALQMDDVKIFDQDRVRKVLIAIQRLQNQAPSQTEKNSYNATNEDERYDEEKLEPIDDFQDMSMNSLEAILGQVAEVEKEMNERSDD